MKKAPMRGCVKASSFNGGLTMGECPSFNGGNGRGFHARNEQGQSIGRRSYWGRKTVRTKSSKVVRLRGVRDNLHRKVHSSITNPVIRKMIQDNDFSHKGILPGLFE